MPKVLNKRTSGDPVGSVYIGRPSKWGNPFQISMIQTRKEAIARYEKFLLKSPLMNDLHELRGKDLVCWCAPQACHGDVLLKLANK